MSKPIERRPDCESFAPKEYPNQCGDCQTDGHYLCIGCRRIAPFEDMELYDNRMRYYNQQQTAANLRDSGVVTHSANGHDYLLVAVPEGARDFKAKYFPNMGTKCLSYTLHGSGWHKTLPYSNDYEFMFLASTAGKDESEQLAEVISYTSVSGHEMPEYLDPLSKKVTWIFTAKGLLQNLIKSHFPTHTGDVAVVKVATNP